MSSAPPTAEATARAALTALKDASIIRSTKADWRLVAAAQAMRSRTYSDDVAALVRQHGHISYEDLRGQGRFPDRLPEPGVAEARLVQDYDPPCWRFDRERDRGGILRTDYLLW